VTLEKPRALYVLVAGALIFIQSASVVRKNEVDYHYNISREEAVSTKISIANLLDSLKSEAALNVERTGKLRDFRSSVPELYVST
jgi:hypothetical protein